MNVVVITKNYCIETIILGSITDEIKNRVKLLNENAFNGDEWQINERYVEKDIRDLATFLFPDGFESDKSY